MKAVAVARQQLDEAQLRTSVKDKLGARGLWLPGGALILICCVGAFFLRQSSTPKDSFSAIPTFEVQEGPLLISVLESGTISAREQRIIKSEVEGQKQITWLIPEGEYVKKGDLLLQLDSGYLEDQLLRQQIEVQSAEADFIKAREQLAIQKLDAESTVSAAELRLQFAGEDLTKYIKGDFPLDVKSAEAQVILAVAELVSTRGTTTTARMPRMTTTARISMSVNPRLFRFGVSIVRNSLSAIAAGSFGSRPPAAGRPMTLFRLQIPSISSANRERGITPAPKLTIRLTGIPVAGPVSEN